jgi:hypothetical protein
VTFTDPRCAVCRRGECVCASELPLGAIQRQAHAARWLVDAWREGVYPCGPIEVAPEASLVPGSCQGRLPLTPVAAW